MTAYTRTHTPAAGHYRYFTLRLCGRYRWTVRLDIAWCGRYPLDATCRLRARLPTFFATLYAADVTFGTAFVG